MLKLRNLTKRFGEVVAVDDLSIEVREGEIFGLLGPNGAGKTTTVNMAVGILKPDSGSVEIAGFGPPSQPEVRSKIGIAPQSLALYENLSAEENIEFFGRIYGLRGRHLKERVDWCLALVGLAERRRSPVRTFSGGMMRRLNLAAALVHDPPLLLLDEPTVGVDAQSRNAIFERIEELRRNGKTIIYTTHYMEEAQRLCDRVGILDHGRLLALDTVDNLIATYGGKTTIVAEGTEGRIEIETNDPLGELARLHARAKLTSLSIRNPDLEQVFLNLTGRHLRDM